MNETEFPAEFLELLPSVSDKRPKTVIDHILAHGHITTEELSEIYGYSHPPRAARDVRELGIPLVTFRVRASDGRSIGAYRFGDPSQVRATELSGRTAFSARIKEQLVDRFGARCNITLARVPEGELQIDHRVPFEIAGAQDDEEPTEAYMLLSASANRAKSWSCEHCPNWAVRDPDVCRSCYWAVPESYSHVATREERRLDMTWSGEEMDEFERLKGQAEDAQFPLPEFVKEILREHLRGS